MGDTCNKLDTWNRNYFDWCWNCFNMGMKLNVSETWVTEIPEQARYSKNLIQKLQKQNQTKYNYFSCKENYYIMSIPEIKDNSFIIYLIPGFIFLIKEHIGKSVILKKWEVKNNNLNIYFYVE